MGEPHLGAQDKEVGLGALPEAQCTVLAICWADKGAGVALKWDTDNTGRSGSFKQQQDEPH